MERYESYKDSGVEWIGKVPKHWGIGRMKYTGKFENGLIYSANDISDDSGKLVLRSSNIQSCRLNFTDCIYVHHAPDELMVQKGDIIICSRNGSVNLIGKCAYIENDMNATFGAFMLRYRPQIHSKFAFYLFQSVVSYYKGLFSTTTINQLTKEAIGQMKIPLAPDYEQQALAAYLDKRCSEIDKAIATQQKRIALLQELKQSIIAQAVTRGIHPDVPLKESGVEWIGKVPEHWEVAFLKRYCSIKTGSTPSTKESKFYDSEDINWFTPGDFQSDILFDSNKKISDFARACNACKIFPARSIYMIGIGGTIGKIAVCNEIASANQQINIIIPNRKVYYKYVHYCLTSQKEEIILSANVVTLPIINQDKTGYLLLPIPPLNEQEDIVAYIEYRCKSIDRFISKAKRQIELLQELKQSVITEAITGKIKVC